MGLLLAWIAASQTKVPALNPFGHEENDRVAPQNVAKMAASHL